MAKISYCVQDGYVLMCARTALARLIYVSEEISVVPSALLAQVFNSE